MKIIDSHIHVGVWNYKYYAPIGCTICQVNKLLKNCNILGAALFSSDRRNNEYVMNQIKKRGERRYWYFFWINPRDKKSLNFIDKNIEKIAGLKFHSGIDRIEGGVSAPRYQKFLDYANQKELPVIIHSGRWQQMSSYKFALIAAKRYRKLKVIISHQGGDFEKLKLEAPEEAKRMNLENVYFDTSATREYWTIKIGIKILGIKKFIFGSDYPIMHPKMCIEAIKVLGLRQKAEECIFANNFLQILKGRPYFDRE